ncbi:hypothetical protein GF336_07800 [Candidatus Woesearchaeota archaeon]|nr:hypothetical protein [Candidatus Woesearchaeota archaeon]
MTTKEKAKKHIKKGNQIAAKGKMLCANYPFCKMEKELLYCKICKQKTDHKQWRSLIVCCKCGNFKEMRIK